MNHDSDPTPEDEPIAELAIRYLLGDLDETEVAHLQSMLETRPEARVEFSNLLQFHALLFDAVRGGAAKDAILSNHPTASEYREILSQLEPSEPVSPVALAELDPEPDRRSQSGAQWDDDKRRRPRVIVIPRSLAYAAGLAVAALLAIVALPLLTSLDRPGKDNTQNQVAEQPDPSPTPIAPIAVATLLDVEGAVWSDGSHPEQGAVIYNRSYELAEGFAVLKMHNQAIVRLEAPALIEFQSDHAVALRSGRLLGYCNQQARGFVVETASARYIDLGTEFGVLAEPGVGSELHVFEGVVAASVPGDNAAAEAAPYSAGQAVRVAAGSNTLEAIQADANAFSGKALETLALRGGGQGLSDSRPMDPDWSLVEIDGKQLNMPQPVRLLDLATLKPHLLERFLPNDPQSSSWLTIPFRQLGAGAEQFTFERTLDLSGYDPASVEIVLDLIADNYIHAITLNGKDVLRLSEPPGIDGVDQLFNEFESYRLEEGFKPGVNTIRIEIGNYVALDEEGRNHTALRVELAGWARRSWHSQKDTP